MRISCADDGKPFGGYRLKSFSVTVYTSASPKVSCDSRQPFSPKHVCVEDHVSVKQRVSALKSEISKQCADKTGCFIRLPSTELLQCGDKSYFYGIEVLFQCSVTPQSFSVMKAYQPSKKLPSILRQRRSVASYNFDSQQGKKSPGSYQNLKYGNKHDSRQNGLDLNSRQNGLDLNSRQNGLDLNSRQNGLDLNSRQNGLDLNSRQNGLDLNSRQQHGGNLVNSHQDLNSRQQKSRNDWDSKETNKKDFNSYEKYSKGGDTSRNSPDDSFEQRRGFGKGTRSRGRGRGGRRFISSYTRDGRPVYSDKLGHSSASSTSAMFTTVLASVLLSLVA
ncbi:hypothetical protein EB796_025296 [Bugula neritina]|uniref:Uncharacterized protein n=1 Tax=Bugula neritina TaxID=10212 RepID=A0A7J7IR34_BUGNE|nr:hypothetical protein EB796_025296 [Bugula neritina]